MPHLYPPVFAKASSALDDLFSSTSKAGTGKQTSLPGTEAPDNGLRRVLPPAIPLPVIAQPSSHMNRLFAASPALDASGDASLIATAAPVHGLGTITSSLSPVSEHSTDDTVNELIDSFGYPNMPEGHIPSGQSINSTPSDLTLRNARPSGGSSSGRKSSKRTRKRQPFKIPSVQDTTSAPLVQPVPKMAPRRSRTQTGVEESYRYEPYHGSVGRTMRQGQRSFRDKNPDAVGHMGRMTLEPTGNVQPTAGPSGSSSSLPTAPAPSAALPIHRLPFKLLRLSDYKPYDLGTLPKLLLPIPASGIPQSMPLLPNTLAALNNVSGRVAVLGGLAITPMNSGLSHPENYIHFVRLITDDELAALRATEGVAFYGNEYFDAYTLQQWVVRVEYSFLPDQLPAGDLLAKKFPYLHRAGLLIPEFPALQQPVTVSHVPSPQMASSAPSDSPSDSLWTAEHHYTHFNTAAVSAAEQSTVDSFGMPAVPSEYPRLYWDAAQ
ncbi:hypothetical protein R3P38DRAFT_536517 [Favolaschia claudopus]|uniref:Uncharacterized protein n=1 Tax=Favolaschia claudopus TaxID=2862362 RepID=A0AAW0CGE5_9AGAR